MYALFDVPIIDLPATARSVGALVLMTAVLCFLCLRALWRARLPEGLFPVRGRWLRYFLSTFCAAGVLAGLSGVFRWGSVPTDLGQLLPWW